MLYPALALNDEKGHATMAYTEQSATKVQMAALQDMDPMTQDYLDKLEHIRSAVAHHVYEEEGNWFVDLAERCDEAQQQKLSTRYTEEFERYAGDSSGNGTGHGLSSSPSSHQARNTGLTDRPFTLTNS